MHDDALQQEAEHGEGIVPALVPPCVLVQVAPKPLRRYRVVRATDAVSTSDPARAEDGGPRRATPQAAGDGATSRFEASPSPSVELLSLEATRCATLLAVGGRGRKSVWRAAL
jgi:hypothetical protein